MRFNRYDHRLRGISRSRGWLLYVGGGKRMLVLGFHRSSYLRRAWMEITWYGVSGTWDVYPGISIPRRFV